MSSFAYILSVDHFLYQNTLFICLFITGMKSSDLILTKNAIVAIVTNDLRNLYAMITFPNRGPAGLFARTKKKCLRLRRPYTLGATLLTSLRCTWVPSFGRLSNRSRIWGQPHLEHVKEYTTFIEEIRSPSRFLWINLPGYAACILHFYQRWGNTVNAEMLAVV